MSYEPVVIEVNEAGDRIEIHAGFRSKEQCKLVPGSRWDPEAKLWSVSLSWAACNQLRGIFGEEMQVGAQLLAWSQQEVMTRVGPCMELRTALNAEGDPKLYPFQRAGVQFLDIARDAILADEMGTGKTVQLTTLLRTLNERGDDPFPCLVIAPDSVKTVWRNIIKQFAPDITVAVVSGGAVARRKAIAQGADVTIINYESAWRMSRLAGYGNMALTDAEKEPKELNDVPWRTIIADEAHRLKNPKAKQTRAVWWLAHSPSVTRRYALTGTPLANAPDDLWAILHMIAPYEWPAKTKYVDRYCLQSWNPFGGLDVVGIMPEHKEEFFKIIDPRLRRMPKALVLPFLPPKVRSVREAEMTTKQAKAYKQMQESMITDLNDKVGEEMFTVATLPIVQNLRLMQFSSSHAQIEVRQNAQGEAEEHVRLDFPSNKIDALVEFMDELPADEPLVVFAESRQLIEMAGRKLEDMRIPCRYIVGGMTPDQRDQSTSDFQEGRARVILLTIKAGGEGITLTRASQCVFLQRSWSMLANKQAEDRIHRIGSEQHTSVHITDFVAPNTIEEEQILTLHEKFNRLQEIVRDREILQTAAAAGDPTAIAKLAELEAEEAAIENEDDIARSIVKHNA